MSTPRLDTYKAIEVVAQAIQSGSLPRNTDIHSSGPHITVTIDTQNYYNPDFNEIRLMAELFATTFWGGKIRRLQCIHKGTPRRKIPAKDRMEYRAPLANGNIMLRFVAEHECREFTGSARTGESPIWSCRGCSRRLTVTECRKLGLLPPLVKGRKP